MSGGRAAPLRLPLTRHWPPCLCHFNGLIPHKNAPIELYIIFLPERRTPWRGNHARRWGVLDGQLVFMVSNVTELEPRRLLPRCSPFREKAGVVEQKWALKATGMFLMVRECNTETRVCRENRQNSHKRWSFFPFTHVETSIHLWKWKTCIEGGQSLHSMCSGGRCCPSKLLLSSPPGHFAVCTKGLSACWLFLYVPEWWDLKPNSHPAI